jgi:hypothetical protein
LIIREIITDISMKKPTGLNEAAWLFFRKKQEMDEKVLNYKDP